MIELESRRVFFETTYELTPSFARMFERTMKKARTPENPSDFDQFWAKYPRHVGKAAAKRKWDRLHLSPETVAQIMAALEWQLKLPQWQDEEYIPHASTYLHNARWEDEPPRRKNGVRVSTREPWICPHVQPCGSRSICANATFLGKPEKPKP